MSQATQRPVVLALYRDPALLPCVERPGFAGGPPGVVIELSLHARLRRLFDSPAPGVAPVLSTPVLFAPTWRRTVPSLLALAAEQLPEARGPVVLLCHTQDARYFIDSLGPVTTTRLLWHPSDRADHRLGELLGRIQRSALRASVPPEALYLASSGRAASGEDWQRTVTCPILGALARLGRDPSTLPERLAREPVALGA